MSKKPQLSFETLGVDLTQTAAEAAIEPVKKRGKRATGQPRGRPLKRPDRTGEKVFAMTVRLPASLRLDLRRAADRLTDKAGKVVSVHDIVLAALERHLRALDQQVSD